MNKKREEKEEKKWKSITLVLFILLLIIFVFNIASLLAPQKAVKVSFTGAASTGIASFCLEKNPYIAQIPEFDIIINSTTLNTNFYYKINATSRSCVPYPFIFFLNNSKIQINSSTGEINLTLKQLAITGLTGVHNITVTAIENCTAFPNCKFATASFIINITCPEEFEECREKIEETEAQETPQMPAPVGGGEDGRCRPLLECSAWTACIDGYEERICQDQRKCVKPPYGIERKECVPEPTCYDKINNGNEEGTDCGGSCPSKCPGLEKPATVRLPEIKTTFLEKAGRQISDSLKFVAGRINIYFLIVALIFVMSSYAFWRTQRKTKNQTKN